MPRVAPRVVIAGLSGGSGKTMVSLGLARALSRAGARVRAFKKGPDYIDAAWLGLAAGGPCTNLDPFLLAPDPLAALFVDKAEGADLALIEGNRGLFDGKDVSGTCSTAELARRLAAPVILVMDATKMTRTAAAVVLGCQHFEPDTGLAGVVLNRTAGDRHRGILTRSIEHYTGLPVLGALPKMDDALIPERHMGLVSDREQDGVDEILDRLADAVGRCLDLERIRALAAAAPPLARPEVALWPEPVPGAADPDRPVRIGYVHDAALWFYYPENLEALARAGAELVRLSILDPAPWPEIHGLYLGGGFPETHARALAANQAVRERVRALVADGLPIYAECGGFMYLCRELEFEGEAWPMAGVFDLRTGFCARPQGLGYVAAEVVRPNPFHEVGTELRGHEFHYSCCRPPEGPLPDMALRMTRGAGMLLGLDAAVTANTWASYTHLFALGAPHWAPNFVRAALRRRDGVR
ncbi:MAG: cobyrinate a,c-diamide synthase [Desulfovibrionaceae bacterium]